ncbi:CgeB family protein [Yunchengibacter salinarum]|uniref:CgeB family protein n=1 Tax=Yunchengibacter salinarum TaxID=3133399 RepID=UPI0035B59F97
MSEDTSKYQIIDMINRFGAEHVLSLVQKSRDQALSLKALAGTLSVAGSCPQPRPICPPAQGCGLRIGLIADEFSIHCWWPEAWVILLDRHHWMKQIELEKPHFVLLESAWEGNFGDWKDCFIKERNRQGFEDLSALIQACGTRHIPVVFWNKEDPVFRSEFLSIAILADFVLTSDAESIPFYRNTLGHDRIAPLLFAAQPRLHNPAREPGTRKEGVAFAGSYYQYAHELRKSQIERMIKLIDFAEGDIFDRHFGSIDPAYQFPKSAQKFVRGRLNYLNLSKAYKNYKAFLNVNTVTHSSTMMARRVFEILASGTTVLSTPSKALDNLFLDEVIQLKNYQKDELSMTEALNDDFERLKRDHRGIRNILSGHTYFDRLTEIIQHLNDSMKAKIPLPSPSFPRPKISTLILGLPSPSLPPSLPNTFANQHADVLDCGCRRKLDLAWLKERMDKGVTHVLVTSSTVQIGPNLLDDLALSLRYQNADVVGFNSFFIEDQHTGTVRLYNPEDAHTWTSSFLSPILFIKIGILLDIIKYNENKDIYEMSDLLRICNEIYVNKYSFSPFNINLLDNYFIDNYSISNYKTISNKNFFI